MSDLDAVAALIEGGQPRFETLRAVGRHWTHRELHMAAFMSAAQGAVLTSRDSRQNPSVPSAHTEETDEPWRLWVQSPDRVRAEFLVGGNTVAAVFEGATWWSLSPALGARTNNGKLNKSHGKGPGEILIEPATVTEAVSFDAFLGSATRAGRPGFRVHARPVPRVDPNRHLPPIALHDLGSGADEYEFVVDAETGILLRVDALRERMLFQTIEITQVAIDEPLEPDTFVLDLPTGAEFKELEFLTRPRFHSDS